MNWKKVIAAMGQRAGELSAKSDVAEKSGDLGLSVLYSKRSVELIEMASFLNAGLSND